VFRACNHPPKIPNGYNKYGSLAHGSKAIYQCFNGYELLNQSGELKCNDSVWVGQIPICSRGILYWQILINNCRHTIDVKMSLNMINIIIIIIIQHLVNCSFPGILENGRILYIGSLGEYTYQPYMTSLGQNKQIKYECNKGKVLVDIFLGVFEESAP
jgi:hypothetical protein